MIVAVSKTGEALLAVCALKRLFSCVQTHVHLQVRLLNRSFGAVRTSIHRNLPTCHMSLLKVTFEALISCVATTTTGLQADELAISCLKTPGELASHTSMRDHCSAGHAVAEEFVERSVTRT